MPPIYQFHPIVLFYWLVAFSIWEWVFVVGSLRVASSKTYIEYYTKLPSWVPITGDFLYSTLIFLTAQWVFPWVSGLFGASIPPLAAFVLTFIGTQWVYDLTYGFIVSRLPSTTSKYVDFFQRYMKEFGFLAAIGDTLYGLAWIALTWFLLRYVPLSVAIYLLIAAIFLWIVVKY
jgi:hypothetical protein